MVVTKVQRNKTPKFITNFPFEIIIEKQGEWHRTNFGGDNKEEVIARAVKIVQDAKDNYNKKTVMHDKDGVRVINSDLDTLWYGAIKKCNNCSNFCDFGEICQSCQEYKLYYVKIIFWIVAIAFFPFSITMWILGKIFPKRYTGRFELIQQFFESFVITAIWTSIVLIICAAIWS